MNSADSPGPSTSATDLAVLFDLDGTILSINSYPVWARYMMRGRFGLPRLARLKLATSTLAVLLARRLKRLSHAEAKRRLQRLWSAALAAETRPLAEARLIAVLNAAVRPGLEEVLARVHGGKHPAVLATAAAAEYALPLGRHLGFRHVLATPRHDTGAAYEENVGERKRAAALDYLANQGWADRRLVFFTDHGDDLPLIRASHLVLWFGEEAALHSVRREAPEARIVSCAGWSAAQMLEAIDGMAD